HRSNHPSVENPCHYDRASRCLRMPGEAMNPKAFDLSRRPYWIIAGIVLIGFALRLHVVLGSVYHFDEEREWIPFARSISFTPGEVNLPARVISHPILPAYFIKVGSLIGGENPFGFRLMSVIAGSA